MPHKRTVNQEAVRVAKAATNWPNRKVGEGGKNEREKNESNREGINQECRLIDLEPPPAPFCSYVTTPFALMQAAFLELLPGTTYKVLRSAGLQASLFPPPVSS